MSDTHGKDVRPTALTTPECTGLYVASVERQMATHMAHSWVSKTGCYENPHAVTGGKAFGTECRSRRSEERRVGKECRL